MAAPTRNIFQLCSLVKRFSVNGGIIQKQHRCINYALRHYANSSKIVSKKSAVVLSKDGNTVICWHPEENFPYEHTKPIPRSEAAAEGDSVLKVQFMTEERDKYRKSRGPTDKQLREMFYTTRHTWDPKPQKRYAKDPPPPDREAL